MNAAVCRAHGKPLVIEAIEVAPPGPGQVRVNIEVCAICHSDITYARGGWGGPLPSIFGHEAAGVVESIGPGAGSVVPGQRVVVGLVRSCGTCFHCQREETHLCNGLFDDRSPFSSESGESIAQGLRTGAFSQQTVVHHSQVVAVPDDIPLASACLLACGVITGFGAVTKTARMQPASSAAVIGVGGVGMSAVQGAAHCRAATLIAVDLVASKLERALAFGATVAGDASQDDAIEAVQAATDGLGADYVFVAAGVAQAISDGLQMVRRGGTVVFIGMPPSGVAAEIEVAEFCDASLTILGSKMGSADPQVDVPYLIDLYRSGELRLERMVSDIYPLDLINEAMTGVERGDDLRNVIRLS